MYDLDLLQYFLLKVNFCLKIKHLYQLNSHKHTPKPNLYIRRLSSLVPFHTLPGSDEGSDLTQPLFLPAVLLNLTQSLVQHLFVAGQGVHVGLAVGCRT